METLVSTHPLYSGPRRDPQNHFTGFYMLPTTVPTETDPLGSERVRVAEHKEVQRRQVERNHEQPKEVLGQAGSSRPPPTEARKSYGEHMGWPQFSHQPQDPKQAPIAISGLSTCYYWDKHQNDSKQPPCHMGITCRSLHRHVQGVPIAPAPNSDSQSTNTAAIDARKARATAKVHSAQRNPPFINLPPLLNYPLRDERHIGEAVMKAREMPPQRPSGPSPLGSSQRSKAELKVPQVSLPPRPKTSPSPFSSHLEVSMMTDIPSGDLSKFYFNTLRNDPFDTWSPSMQPLPSTSSIQVGTPSYSGTFMSEDSKEILQMRESMYFSIRDGLRRDEIRKVAEQRALQQEQESLRRARRAWRGAQEYKAPEKRKREGELGFSIEPYYPPIPFKVWSAQEQAKKMEQELRREEERGEKGINQRARAAVAEHMALKSQDNSKIDLTNAQSLVLTSNPANLGGNEPTFAYARGRKVELRELVKGPLYLSNTRGGALKEPFTDIHGNPVNWPPQQKPVLDNQTPKSTIIDKVDPRLQEKQKLKLGEGQSTSTQYPPPARKVELPVPKLSLVNRTRGPVPGPEKPGPDNLKRKLEQLKAAKETSSLQSVNNAALDSTALDSTAASTIEARIWEREREQLEARFREIRDAQIQQKEKQKLGETQTTSFPPLARMVELPEQKYESFGTYQPHDPILELINQEPDYDGFRGALKQLNARREPFRLKSVSGKSKTQPVKQEHVPDKPMPYSRVVCVMDDLLGKPMSMQGELDDLRAAWKDSVAGSNVSTSSFKTAPLIQPEMKQSTATAESGRGEDGGEFEEINIKDEVMSTPEEKEDWIVV
jgi:hypothetical protein